MCVSQYNNRLFLAILLGVFITSGCSGHSVKYGANSEGEEMVSSEEEIPSFQGVQIMDSNLMGWMVPVPTMIQ